MNEQTVIQIIDRLHTYFQGTEQNKEIGVAYHNQYGISPVIYVDVPGEDRVLFGKLGGFWRIVIKPPGSYSFGNDTQKITDTTAIEQLENIIAISEQERTQAILDYLQT